MNSAPLPSDGWKSRKLIIGLGLLVVVGVASFSCMFVEGADQAPVADFDQWSGFMWKFSAGVLTPLFAAIGLDKNAEAKARTAGAT